MKSWPWISGHALRSGVDLFSLSAPQLFDFLDVEREDFEVLNGKFEGAMDKQRQNIARMYGYEYEYQYGTNDTVGSPAPLGRDARPYLPEVEQNEFGYVGFDPPLE